MGIVLLAVSRSRGLEGSEQNSIKEKIGEQIMLGALASDSRGM